VNDDTALQMGCEILMNEEELTIDKKVIRAISSNTRVSILKALRQRQKTQSEIAVELNFSVPTVLEHIEQLEDAHLVERVPTDKERKWVYYQLTKTGRNVIESKRMNIIVLLAIGLLAITTAFVFFNVYKPYSQTSYMALETTGASEASGATKTSAMAASQTAASVFPLFEVLVLAVLLICVLWLVRSYLTNRK